MRITTLHRAYIETGHKRLDPPFYFQRAGIRDLLTREESRHVALGDLISEMYDGARLLLKDDGIPMLRLNNLKPCELDLVDTVRVESPSGNSWPSVRPGDVLFTRSAVPFRSAVVHPDAPSPMTVSQEITILRPRPAILPEFLAAVLSTRSFSGLLRDLSYRGSPSALQRIRLKDILRLPIPLPRRSVQEEIRKAYLQAFDLSSKAHEELSRIIRAVHSEVNARLDLPQLPKETFFINRNQLGQRWNVSFSKSRLFRDALMNNRVMKPLLQLARAVPSGLKGIDEDDMVLTVQAENINEATFMVEGAEPSRLAELSARMRQPLSVGDVLLCTTGSGRQIAYLDDALGQSRLPILGSATFTAFRFTETPRFFAVILSHPVVRSQLDLVASGTVQRFVNKRDLDDLILPCLSLVWREDFDARIDRAMQRRREALAAKAYLLEVAEAFIKERWSK